MNLDFRVQQDGNDIGLLLRRKKLWSRRHSDAGYMRINGIGISLNADESITYPWTLNVVTLPTAPVIYAGGMMCMSPPYCGPSDAVMGRTPFTQTSIIAPFTSVGSLGLFNYFIIESDIITQEQFVETDSGIAFVLNLPSNPNTDQGAYNIDVNIQPGVSYMYAQFDPPDTYLPPDYITITGAKISPVESANGTHVSSTFNITLFPQSQVTAPNGSRLVLLLQMSVLYTGLTDFM